MNSFHICCFLCLVEANPKQKGKPPQKTEKPPKPFEEKKIWKSEPFNGKKGIFQQQFYLYAIKVIK